MKIPQRIIENYSATGEFIAAKSGEGRTYVGVDKVLKYINDDKSDELIWISKVTNLVIEKGFRISKPIKGSNGKWIYDGWQAWNLIQGSASLKQTDIRKAIISINKFHEAVKHLTKPEFLQNINSPYRKADKFAWNELETIKSNAHVLWEDIRLLQNLLKPIHMKNQLIHSDLNPDNILFKDNLHPGLIDFTPAWRPKEFALCVYAYWVGPWRGNVAILKEFYSIPNMYQLLIRAGLRMLYTVIEFNHKKDIEAYRNATRLIVDVVTN